jgi:hypothetical protein
MANAAQRAAANKSPKLEVVSNETTPAEATPARTRKSFTVNKESAAKKAAARKSVDIEAMLAGATTTKEALPKIEMNREGGNAKPNAFTPLVQKSFDEGVRVDLPAVPSKEIADALTPTIRRGATLAGLQVKIRHTVNADETVIIHLQAHKKS